MTQIFALDKHIIFPRVNYLTITGVAVLTLVLLISTFRRKDKRRLALRAIATMVATTSLLLLALRPHWRSIPLPISALLITSGTTQNQLEVLVKSYDFGNHVFSLDGTKSWQPIFRKVKAIPDAAYLKRHHPEIQELHVAGHGLNDFDWAEIDSLPIIPHLAPSSNGIKNIQWSREVVLGQPLKIQGTLAAAENEGHRLYLLDLAGVVDSVEIATPEKAQFQLQATPREIGRYLYTLQLRTKAGLLVWQEIFGVVVVPSRAFKMLVLESAPRFETKYLKNWLGKHQNAVAIRSAVSKERYRTEFINHAGLDLVKFDANLLKRFDLIMLDGQTLFNMMANERWALRTVVENAGLGVLIVPDEIVWQPDDKNFPEQSFFLPFRFDEFSGLEERLIKPTWDDFPFRAITEIPADPFEIKYDWGMRPLIKDEMERILGAVSQRGNGRVGSSLIKDTYRWILEGNPQYHAAYWSYLIAKLARPEQSEQWSVISSGPVFVHQPITLRLMTAESDPVGMVSTETGLEDVIHLRQNMDTPEIWRGTYCPRQIGWHRVAAKSGEPYWFYVHEKESWQTWQQAQRMEATKRHAACAKLSSKTTPRAIQSHSRPIPLYPFFFTFLLSCAFLWIERKL